VNVSRAIHDRDAVASFYHLRAAPAAGSACRGLGCFAARADNPDRWSKACSQSPTVYCLGMCHAAPAAAGEDQQPSARCAAASPVLLGNILVGGVRKLDAYLADGGGQALDRARSMTSDALIDEITQSGLRGRGGAGFPAGRKWAAVRDSGENPVIVVNADEGDPGAFSDKALLEDDPFRLFEAIAITAQAIGAHEAVIYLRCEYPNAAQILTDAIAKAEAANWPGDVSIKLVSGKGSYVCGEETSLLNALEERRPFVRARPPYPFQSGLHGRPTLVHNVETLCAVPWIVEHGADAYRSLKVGNSQTGGTKLLSLNSMFHNPGLVEMPFGMTLRTIVEDLGGGLKRGNLMGVMIGGPLAGLLPPSALDTPFTYEDLATIGGAVGHGGVIAFADDTDLASLIAEVFRFGASESCGLCVPCHLGTAELAQAFSDLADGRARITREHWNDLIAALKQTSLCGHGGGLADFALSLERHYPEELAACLQ
jgi:formate dehydrogenase iron-sulfur subunit